MTQLFIVGAGGHASVVADSALLSTACTSIVFVDDKYTASCEMQLSGHPVCGPIKRVLLESSIYHGSNIVVAIGSCTERLLLQTLLSDYGYKPISIVHPFSWVSPNVAIGAGTVIFAGSIVQTGSFIGEGVIINTGASVDHDCVLGRAVHICPGARLAGNVSVGDRTWIGIGSTVVQGISIGADVTVAAGAVVTENLPDNCTAIGVPARILPRSIPPIVRHL
jgi:sugar O-acyltransferase (sialic acid O-acetyltransferase NeuD family)